MFPLHCILRIIMLSSLFLVLDIVLVCMRNEHLRGSCERIWGWIVIQTDFLLTLVACSFLLLLVVWVDFAFFYCHCIVLDEYFMLSLLPKFNIILVLTCTLTDNIWGSCEHAGRWTDIQTVLMLVACRF